MATTHRIRRQTWQVSAPDAGTAFALRTYLRQAQESDLLPAIARAFDALDTGGRTLRIPRLDLTIRTGADNWADRLPEQVFEALALALQDAISDESAPPDLASVSAEGRLAHYLVSGQLPWFDSTPGDEAGLPALQREALRWSRAPALAWDRLGQLLPSAAAARHAFFFRFLQLLNDDALAQWHGFLAERALTLSPVGRDLLSAAVLVPTAHADARLRVQALAMAWLAESRALADWPDFARRCLQEAGVDALPPAALATLLLDGEANPAGVAGAAGHNVRLTPPPPLDYSLPAADPALQNSPIFPVDRSKAPGLPVIGCGLVILHPYLPRLFAGLGWLPESHRRGEVFPVAHRARAAALLHWLATARAVPYEFELPLIKVLLGLHPDDPLPVGEGLLDAETQAEGEALLSAALAHWPALGQTSAEGLRVAFLQRGGLLYPAPEGWLLRPQSETYDLLLDRLPWGISIIRLPWMLASLHTEWSPP